MIREADGDGTPYRRLLDLLAGWMEYVRKCSADEHGDPAERVVYEKEFDAIHALYQDIGTRDGAYAELDRQAYAFLGKQVADLVVLGAVPPSSVAEEKKP